MSRGVLKEILEPLPYNLKEQINGYIATVDNSKVDVFYDAGVEYEEDLAEKYIFLAGLRRLWTLVDTNFWIMDNSISLVQESKVNSFQIGSTFYKRDSESYIEIRELRNKFLEILSEQNLKQITEVRTLRELLISVKEGEM